MLELIRLVLALIALVLGSAQVDEPVPAPQPITTTTEAPYEPTPYAPDDPNIYRGCEPVPDLPGHCIVTPLP